MNEILVGDRVIVSNSIGTVRPNPTEYVENKQYLVRNIETGVYSVKNFKENHTFYIEWDDITRGNLEGESIRLEKLKESKNKIIKHFNYLLGDKFYDSRLYEILNTMFYNLDSCRPFSVVNLEHISKGSTFESEFKNKYLSTTDNLETIEMDGMDKTYEFVGVDKACNFFSDANNLFSVTLNECTISKLGNIEKFPKCSELYLANNLLKGSEINKLFKYFPKLEVLDVSGNQIDEPLEASSLVTLILNRTFVDFKTLLVTIDRSPKLSRLILTNNFIEDIEFDGRSYPSVKSIDLSSNLIYKWSTIFTLFKLFPNLEKIVIENNFLSKIVPNLVLGHEYNLEFPGLVDLDLSYNLISNLDTLVNLSQIFPNIKRLKIMPNPFDFNNLDDQEVEMNGSSVNNGNLNSNNTNNSNNNTDTNTNNYSINKDRSSTNKTSTTTSNKNNSNAISINTINSNFLKILQGINNLNSPNKDNFNEILRMFVIVTFPKLTILNGTNITVEERVNSERYLNYLENKGNTTNNNINRDNNGNLNNSNSNNTNNSNKIKVLLIPDGDSDSFLIEPVEKRLPESSTVADLKLLCSKLFKIDLKDIRLIYNNKKMPLSEELDDDSAELGRYGISDGYEIRAQSKKLKILKL